jgi:ribosomal protein S27AE
MPNLVYQVKKCPKCGGVLSEPDEHSSRVCGSCDAVFSQEAYDDISEHFVEKVQGIINEAFEDKIAEHRRSLWEELQKPIPEKSIYNHAQSICTYNQNDIQANFYLATSNFSSRQTINFLNKLAKEKPNVYKH